MQKTVLIVDDSESIRNLVEVYLQREELEIVQAQDGADALERSRKQHFDLIVTDINMPNLNGYQLIEELRSDPAYQDVPIVILSSLGHEQEIEFGYQIGADAYVVKPFDREMISGQVYSLIEK